MKKVWCVHARDVGMIHKSIDHQPMRRMSECRFRLGHCGRSFLSPAIYKRELAKMIAMSGFML